MSDATRRTAILMLVCALYVMSFFHRVSPAVIALDLQASLDLSPQRLSLLSASTMLAYGLVQMPAGMISDVLGARRTITLLTLCMGLCVVAFALSPSFAPAVTARWFTGIFAAVSVPSMGLLAAWYAPERYGRIVSLFLCCGGLGGLLAAPPLVLLSDLFGWRVPILLAGGVTLALGGLCALIIRDRPAEKEAATPAAAVSPVPPTTSATVHTSAAAVSPVSARASRTDQTSDLPSDLPTEQPTARAALPVHPVRQMIDGARTVFRTPAFWPPALWIMCMTGMYFALASLWWGPYLMEGCGFSKNQTGLFLSAVSLTLLCGQPLMGYLSDRVFRSRKRPVILASLMALAASFPLALWPGQIAFWPMLGLFIVFIAGVASIPPVAFANIKELFPLRLAGTAIGCGNMFFPLWSAAFQAVFGLVVASRLADTGSPQIAYGSAAWLMVGCCALGLALALCMTETYGKTNASNA